MTADSKAIAHARAEFYAMRLHMQRVGFYNTPESAPDRAEALSLASAAYANLIAAMAECGVEVPVKAIRWSWSDMTGCWRADAPMINEIYLRWTTASKQHFWYAGHEFPNIEAAKAAANADHAARIRAAIGA